MDDEKRRVPPRRAAEEEAYATTPWRAVAEEALERARRTRRETLDGLLTDDEHEAVVLAGRVACLLERIAGPDRSRDGDLAEMCGAIHVVQNAVLAQAAARAFPDRYRLMGASPVQRVEAAGPTAIRVTGVAGQSVDVVEETMRMTGTGTRYLAADGVTDVIESVTGDGMSDVIQSVTAEGTFELDPTRQMRLPRYRLREPASFRWRDVLTAPVHPSDHAVLPYGACPVEGPHEPHRWAITGAARAADVQLYDWWLCDPRPGLTGDSSRDLDALAAWSRRHPDGEERPHDWRAKLERCPRCGSDTCPGRGDQLDCTAELDGLTARAEASELLRERHTQMPPAPFASSPPLEERLAAALAVCATELDETDVANVVAAVLPVVRGGLDRAADEALRANPYR